MSVVFITQTFVLSQQKVNKELSTLREALNEAELRANTSEEERNHALQQIQTLNEVSLEFKFFSGIEIVS